VITSAEEEEDEEEQDEEEEEGSSGKVAGVLLKKVALADVRSEEMGEIVEVEGVVSATIGVLGKGIIYLSGSGIQVYLSNGDYPEFALGDRVRLAGKLSSIGGEARIRVSSSSGIEKVGVGELTVHEMETGEIGEEEEGWLVRVSGEVSRTSGSTFYVDDGSGEVRVYIKSSTGIEKPKMKKGMAVRVTGVVSETSSGYRILPRLQEDVEVGAVLGTAVFPKAGWKGLDMVKLFALVIFLTSGLLLLVWGKACGEPMWY
jgi:DNA/RNA endonuclease YhcR with UshA esterase domain